MKNAIIAFSLMFYCSFVLSQTFNERLPLSSPHSLFSGVVVQDDNIYVSGTRIDSLPPYYSIDFLAQFNYNGELLNRQDIGVGENIRKVSFPTLINDENNITYSGVRIDSTRNVVIVNFDAGGNFLWENDYDSYYINPETNFVVSLGLVQDENRNYYSVNNSQLPNGYNNVILTKMDSLGNTIFEKPFGISNKMDVATQIINCSDGNLCMVITQYNHDEALDLYEYQSCLIKTDTLGNTLWTYKSPLEQGQIGFPGGIVEADDGGFVINARYGYEQNIVYPRYMEWEKYIYKISSTGELEWELEVPSAWMSRSQEAWRMIKTSDNSGYVMVATDLLYDGGQEVTTPVSKRGWLGKVDDDGNLLWARNYVGVNSLRNYQVLYDVKETADGGLVAVGYSEDDTADTLALQAWIIKTDEYGCIVPGCQVTNTENPNLPQIKTSLYPNPVSDILNIWYNDPHFDYRNPPQFRITDVSGKVWSEFETDTNDTTLMVSVRELPPGSYFLNCSATRNAIPFVVVH